MKKNQQLAQYVLAHKEFPTKGYGTIFKIIGLTAFSFLALSVFFGYFWLLFTSNTTDSNGFIVLFVSILGIYGFWSLFSFKDEFFSFKKFSEIETHYDAPENFAQSVQVLKQHFKLGDIRADKKSLLIKATTQQSLWTYGDTITIVCDNKRILINCKATRSQLFSYGQQKRHYQTFKKSLQSTHPKEA